jgi:hypothetical protein
MNYYVATAPVSGSSVNTAQVVSDHIVKAQEAYRNSKDAAAKAAAHAYMVWLKTMSPLAEAEARDWLIAEIGKRNDEIDAHNADEEFLQNRVSYHKKKKLASFNSDDILLKTEFATIEEQKLFDDELANVTSLHELKQKDWDGRRKVRIEARQNASEFSVIVKFVFGFDSPSDSSVTTRYAQVLAWIDEAIEDSSLVTANQIFKAIQAAGGFEKVVYAMRGKGKKPPEPEASILVTAAERKLMEAHVALKAMEAAKAAPALVRLDIPMACNSDGLVLIVGRQSEGQIELVGPLGVGSADFSSVISTFSHGDLPTDPCTELLSKVLALGQMVSSGDETGKTLNDLKMEVPLLSERVLTLVPHQKAGLQFVMSARHADASVVIKATPKIAVKCLGDVTEPLMLEGANVSSLASLLSSSSTRGLITLSRNAEKVHFTTTIHNAALTPLKHTHATVNVEWVPIAEMAVKPLDVDGFKPSVCRAYTQADLSSWYADDFAKAHNGAAKKSKREASEVRFEGNAVLRQDAGGYVDAGKLNKAPTTLKFDLAQIADVVSTLQTADSASVMAFADDGGLVGFFWEDALASWELYLPTLTADGSRLQGRRLSPMTAHADYCNGSSK